jgi:bla regulator protein BlaR1
MCGDAFALPTQPSPYVTVCTMTLRTLPGRCAGTALSALLLLAGEFSLGAQLLRPKEPMPSFEVATVKPWKPGTVIPPVGAGRPAKEVPVGAAAPVSDRVHFIGQIELLIETAYGFPFSSGERILGGPDWIRSESDRYEVTGKIDDAHYAAIQKMSPAQQQEQVSLMEQSLLAERLRFRGHIETREMPRYALAIAKGGSKLERAPADARSQMSFVRNGQGNELRATAVTVEELARSPFLRIDKRQIVDTTGLQGRFSFTLKFSNAVAGGSEDDGNAPELPTALQEQLGLRLVPQNGPVEVVVIDHIERPSEN